MDTIVSTMVDETKKYMHIVEIFMSIQGEGVHMGKACTFIRTSGCNLKCSFCDTKDSWDIQKSPKMTLKEIVDTVLTFGNKFVVITGGEPGIQPHLGHLITILKRMGCYVAVESNGTQYIPECADWITISPKKDSNYQVVMPLFKINELKFVVERDFSLEDIPYDIRHQLVTSEIDIPVFLQPNGDDMEFTWKRAYDIVTENPNTILRVGVQLHKIMGVI